MGDENGASLCNASVDVDFSDAVKIIAIVDGDWGVAKAGEIPWSFQEDRRLFYELTKNSTVIMGRKTFESLSCRPLKNRVNCVVSRKLEPLKRSARYLGDSVRFFKSLEDALSAFKNSWIIGGAEIYNYALRKSLVNQAVITMMHQKFGADKFIEGAILESQDVFEKNVLRKEPDYDLLYYREL